MYQVRHVLALFWQNETACQETRCWSTGVRLVGRSSYVINITVFFLVMQFIPPKIKIYSIDVGMPEMFFQTCLIWRFTSWLTPKRNLTSVRFVRNVFHSVLDWRDTSELTPKEKPYQCKYCKKCFSYQSQLTNHIRTHTKEKPYQCDYCQKCFSQRSHLYDHNKTHTKEKPYQCEYCQKCFSQRSHLNDTWELTPKRNRTSVSIVRNVFQIDFT